MITAPGSRVVVIAYNEQKYRCGESHHNARLSDATVDRIRELHEDYHRGPMDIAREMNLPLTTVRKICFYQRRVDTPRSWRRIANLAPRILSEASLTEQQERFVAAYKALQSGKPIKEVAALAAGYSEHSASRIANNLLADPRILTKIEQQEKQRELISTC